MFNVIATATHFPPVFVLLALVLSSVVVVSLVLNKFKQSLLVGYFLCGVIISNSGVLDFAQIRDTSAISSLSEIGIVLLLFTIGIEFSVKELKTLKRAALIGGGVQVGLTIIIATCIAMACGLNWTLALVLGFGFALSSTAVSLKSFQDMGMPETPQSRVTLGIAIFQDLAAIVFMVLIPAIVGDGGLSSLGIAIGKGAAFMVGIMILSRHGLPQMLDAVAQTRSRELFTVTVIGMCAAVALISGMLGLSPALGAFAAGVVVSESIYSHRVLSDVLPFKDLFLTIFFVSVGLLLDVGVMLENAGAILLLSLAILCLKGAITGVAARLSGLKMQTWLLPALALSSTGEFSIVLFNSVFGFKFLTPQWEQIILASTALTMALVPSLMKWGHTYAKRVRTHKSAEVCRWEEEMGIVSQIEALHDHIIICGYGPVGKNLHQNLQRAQVPVVVLEMNPNTVKKLLSEGTKALFADARDPEALMLAKVELARGVAITFPDTEVVETLTHFAREKKKNVLVYARCKFATDVAVLKNAGVNHVMLDEEQSGRAMIRSVMQGYEMDLEENWNV